MISFRPNEDEESFVDVARGLAKEKIRPVAREIEQNGKVNQKLVQEIRELGLLSLELTENWEGLELPLISQVQIWQALAYGDLDTVQGLSDAGDAASFIRLIPDHPVLESFKKTIVEEGAAVSFLDLEHQLFSNLNAGNEGTEYLLNGTSEPVRSAQFADYVLIGAKDSGGESVLLWLNKQEHPWMAEEGDYRLGLLASGLAKIKFQNVRVSSDHVLAKGEEAEKLIKAGRTRIRILQAAKEVGLMEAALDYATEYTAGRKAFGKEIAKFQGVSFRVAEMAMETRAANHLVWEAALKADEEDESADGYSLRALYRAHRSLRFVTDSAVQLLGGHGYVQEYPVEKWMRDAQAQVALYGREKQMLTKRGEQLIKGEKEAAMS
ncbi:acyl-CoA dehydrogenase [Virgibacillus sp. MSP4-1]|uniref:acyl-CoA dehydrogenase family protein n=1 Tax=Virgibacillus sp. MSP4-1 TaxID=2700081 RepID=UPI00039F59F2|nr:acyl-CoA dehydrogenase family protein [Virgibacillus sp. MSP4-1]QHS22705.1 acyl-CoA dehydrogenase [Virgibacillus sp. MSP4-1]